jgi:hypothetical protein
MGLDLSSYCITNISIPPSRSEPTCSRCYGLVLDDLAHICWFSVPRCKMDIISAGLLSVRHPSIRPYTAPTLRSLKSDVNGRDRNLSVEYTPNAFKDSTSPPIPSINIRLIPWLCKVLIHASSKPSMTLWS